MIVENLDVKLLLKLLNLWFLHESRQKFQSTEKD